MLGKMPAQGVDQLSALADEHLRRPKQHGAGLPVFRLQRDKAHGRTQSGLDDRLGIGGIALLPLHERLHIDRWDQAHFMSELRERAPPAMRRRARLHGDDTSRREWEKFGGVCVCWWFNERGTAMDVRITVETTFENGTTKTRRLGRLSRPFRRMQPEGFGLLLEDAKTILGQLQNAILLDQIKEISEASRICPDCDGVRAIHDYRSRVLDTLFGRFQVKAPRIRRCACNAKSDVVLGGPLSPLAHFFPDRSTPELRRLQAEFGACHSFREAARILETFLPCAKQVNTSVRNRLGKVARDFDEIEQTEPLGAAVVEDAAALTVFLDGAHIRCRPEYQKRHLDVVVGKIEGHDKCRRFGLVQQAVLSPARQLRQDLRALGWDHGKAVTVISDGEPALLSLARDAIGAKGSPHPRLVAYLDAYSAPRERRKGLLQIRGFSGIPVLFKRPAETLRWYLWHGKALTAATSLQ
jgi:hypothetical protein